MTPIFNTTSTSWRQPFSKLWRIKVGAEHLEEMYTFKDDEYLGFSKSGSDSLLSIQMDGKAVIYSLSTGKEVRTMKPASSNNNAGTEIPGTP